MRVTALVLVALAGCYDDAPGLRIVIEDPGLGAVKVELFLATRHAMTSAIGADASRFDERRDKLRGDSYFLDGPSDGTTPMSVLDVVDGQVVWNLQADPDGPSRIKLVVAVAYDGQGQAVGVVKLSDVEVPVDDAVAYVLQLQGAQQIAPSDSMEPAGIRVWPWRKTTAPMTAACLGLELSDGTHAVERIWLVPEDDPDCDEVEIECDEFLHRADYSEQATTCIVPAQAGTAQIPCKLGEKVCEDGVSAGGCTPLANPSYCLAAALCDPNACLADPKACMDLDSSDVVCDVSAQQDGSLCNATSMGAGPLAVLLNANNGLFPGGCQAVQFAAPDSTAGFISTPTIAAGGVTFAIDSLSTLSCSFSIDFMGKFDPNMTTPLLLVLDVARGGAHYLVPVFIKVDTDACEERQSSCSPSRGSTIDLGLCQ